MPGRYAVAGLVTLLCFIVLFTGCGAATLRCSSSTSIYASSYFTRAWDFTNNRTGWISTNQNCSWTIRATYRKVVRLNVVNLNLNNSTNCSSASLSVYNGADQQGSLLAKFCGGNDTSRTLRSSGRSMNVVFKSDGSRRIRSFQLQVRAVRPSTLSSTTQVMTSSMTTSIPYINTTNSFNSPCGSSRNLNASYSNTKVLTSPNYPGNYPSNLDCGWKITADQNYVVRLHVVTLNLEDQSYCNFDSLSIYDGGSQNGNLLRKLCGIENNLPYIYSTGRYMYIKFKTDGSVIRSGFRLTYTAVTYPITTTTTTLRPDYGCRPFQTLNARYGITTVLTSPNYPRDYANNLECGWKITAAWNHQYVVRLYVQTLDLEDESGCTYDSLSVYDGGSQDGILLRKLCGTENNLPYIYSTGRYMYIKFKTDGSETRSGFHLNFTAVTRPPTTTPLPDDVCEFPQVLYAQYGHGLELLSPNYPRNYSNNMECGWKITATSNYVVRLYVQTFDLEDESDCDYDSLSVYNGVSPDNSPRLAKLCGRRNGHPYFHSTGRYMYIKFISDTSQTGRGFQLQYQATTLPDGLELFAEIDEEKVLMSNNYPFSYRSFQSKRWTISCDEGYVVRLQVRDMDLQESSDCSENKVTVYSAESSTPIATMCNHQYNGVDLYSVQHTMIVDFETTHAKEGKGFHLTYTAVRPYMADYRFTTKGWTHTTTRSPYVNHHVGALIGGLTGGVVLLFLTVFCGWYLRMRSKKQRPPITRFSTAPPNPSTGSAAVHPNTNSVYVLPNNYALPTFNGHMNLAYSSSSDEPPTYAALQQIYFNPAGTAACFVATAPPMYEEGMLTSHPPSKGPTGGATDSSAEAGAGRTATVMGACQASPPDQPEPVPTVSPDSESGTDNGATSLDSHGDMPAQPEAPAASLALDNTNPEVHD